MGVVQFTASELELLRSQRIARLATVGPTGWPHVVPVMYSMDEGGTAFEFDVDGVKLRNLSSGPERARLTPARKFSWGL